MIELAVQFVSAYKDINQHSQFFFPSCCSALSTIESPSSFTSFSRFALMPSASLRKACSTLVPLRALTSMYCMLFFLANFQASSTETTLSEKRSSFVPTSSLTRASLAVVSTCRVHAVRLAKDSGQVRSKARMIPRAPLKQACVMLRKRSCPAVSQICRRIRRSPTIMSLSLKSTPIVATQLSLKIPSQYLVIKLVLPTPLSPIMTTLARQNSSDLLDIISILRKNQQTNISKIKRLKYVQDRKILPREHAFIFFYWRQTFLLQFIWKNGK